MPRGLRIGHVASYDTSWALTENPISEGGRWLVGGTTGYYQSPRSDGTKCFGAGASAEYNDCLAQLQMPSFSNDHRVEGTVHLAGGYSPGDSHEIGLYLRMGRAGSSSEFVTGYECLFPFSGSFQIIGWLGTHHNDLANFDLGISVTTMNGGYPGVAHGDVIAAQIVGSTIKCYSNGVQFAQATDTRYSTGKPGLGFFVRPGGTPSSLCISRYRALVAT